MVKNSMKELRKLGLTERNKKLEDLTEELLILRSKSGMGGSLENPSRIRIIKRTIARLKTIANEEKL